MYKNKLVIILDKVVHNGKEIERTVSFDIYLTDEGASEMFVEIFNKPNRTYQVRFEPMGDTND